MKFVGAHIFSYDATFRGDVTIEGNLTVSNSVSQTISFGDNDSLYFGNSNDLQIIHDGTDSFISNETGHVYFKNAADDKDIEFQRRVVIKSKTAGNRVAVKKPFTEEIGQQFIKALLDPFTDAAFAFAKSSNQDASFPIRIGNNTYQDCFLSDFSLSVDNFAPVTIDANFVSLSPPTGGNVSGDASPYGGGTIPFDPDDIVYGYTCSLSNATQAVGNVQYRVSYKKSFSRTPVYTLGAANATSMLLNGVESEMSIESTGLNSLIDFSGGAISSDVTLGLNNIDGDGLSTNLPNVVMVNGSKVITQSYSIAGSDTVNTRATIKQIDL